MFIGAAVVEICVHDSQSLKRKRGVVRSISQRVRNKFNLSVAEVGGQGTWQLATLGLAAAGSNGTVVRATLESALEFIEGLHLAEVLNSDVTITSLPHAETGPVWSEEYGDTDEAEDIGGHERDD